MKRIKCKLIAESQERLAQLFERFENEPAHTLHNELTNAYILRLALFNAVQTGLDITEKPAYHFETSVLAPAWLLAGVKLIAAAFNLTETEAQSRLINAGLELLAREEEL